MTTLKKNLPFPNSPENTQLIRSCCCKEYSVATKTFANRNQRHFLYCFGQFNLVFFSLYCFIVVVLLYHSCFLLVLLKLCFQLFSFCRFLSTHFAISAFITFPALLNYVYIHICMYVRMFVGLFVCLQLYI